MSTDAGYGNPLPPELAEVRPNEHLPWEVLASYLLPILGVDGPMTVLQFPNGSANLTYQLTFGERKFVLRRPPFGTIAPGAHDMKREHRVLSKLWREYDRAPRGYVFCDDHDVVGSDFVVSEYRSGVVIWAAVHPSMTQSDAARQLGLATVTALAELHLVDPAACDLSDLGRPDGFVERQLSGWKKRWDLVATPNFDPLISRGFDELTRQLPVSGPPTLLHNDFKMDNCQFALGDPSRVVSVFDWDMATLGDPLIDFGIFLNYWPDPSDTEADRALFYPGMDTMGLPPRAELIAQYGDVMGKDVSHVSWYEAFACWKTCVVLQQLHQRWVRGESTDERMASRGDNIEMLARRALRLLGASG